MMDLFGGLPDQPKRAATVSTPPPQPEPKKPAICQPEPVRTCTKAAKVTTPPRDPRMMPNLGRKPDEAKGKRVVVELVNGRLCGVEPVSTTTQPGWDADGSRWSLTGFGFDIAYYRVL